MLRTQFGLRFRAFQVADKATGGKAKNKVARKATKGAKAKAGDKPAWAGDRAEGGAAKSIGKVPIPRHLLDKVGKADGETFGRTTGLRMVHCVDALLRHNEKVKATDADLSAWLLAEFPKRHSAGSGVKGQKTIQTVAAYRAYHNAGKHGCGDGVHKSSSYNAEGVARVKASAKPAKAKAKPKAKKAKAA